MNSFLWLKKYGTKTHATSWADSVCAVLISQPTMCERNTRAKSCLVRTIAYTLDHPQECLEWSGSTRIHFFKNGTVGWGVFIISSSTHTALQSLTKVAHFSVCYSTQLPSARTRRTAEVVWRGDWTDPDLSAPRRKSASRASCCAN